MNVRKVEATSRIIGLVKARGELGIKVVVTNGERTAKHECLPSKEGSESAQDARTHTCLSVSIMFHQAHRRRSATSLDIFHLLGSR